MSGTKYPVNPNPEWITRGKTIRQLIQELNTFENQDLEVRLSLDRGDTTHPISLVLRQDGYCVLANFEADAPGSEDT